MQVLALVPSRTCGGSGNSTAHRVADLSAAFGVATINGNVQVALRAARRDCCVYLENACPQPAMGGCAG